MMKEFGIYFMDTGNENGTPSSSGIVKELFTTQREASKRAKQLSLSNPKIYYTVFESKCEWNHGKLFKE